MDRPEFTQGRIIGVASLLSQPINNIFQAASPGTDFFCISRIDQQDLPSSIEVLVAAPIADARAFLPRPAGWPFGLRWVHLVSAGLDAYPPWIKDAPIVTNSPGLMGQSLAEYCMAAILYRTKALDEQWISSAEEWKPKAAAMVAGSTLGIIGFGAIGKSLARLARAFDMNVMVLRKSAAGLPEKVARAASLEQVFAVCDHVVLAVPADKSTTRMVDEAMLGHAKPGLHLINVARGSLVDQEALLVALDSGRIGFATLDVTDPEPLPADSRLYGHPRVRLSPHTAGMTPDLVPRLAEMFAANLSRFRSGEPMRNIIPPAVGPDRGEY